MELKFSDAGVPWFAWNCGERLRWSCCHCQLQPNVQLNIELNEIIPIAVVWGLWTMSTVTICTKLIQPGISSGSLLGSVKIHSLKMTLFFRRDEEFEPFVLSLPVMLSYRPRCFLCLLPSKSTLDWMVHVDPETAVLTNTVPGDNLLRHRAAERVCYLAFQVSEAGHCM